ncbi:MAG: glycosyltransferase family 2 protein [Acutalibacteraceae bacterium]
MISGLVSIITPTYNCGKYISETIESVLAQTYTNWEMIIVDDCSTDNTREVVEGFSANDNRIKYHYLEENKGAAVARTVAMKLAEGEYMAFLDSDDLWMPDKLEKQLAFMKEKNCAFSCTTYRRIDEDGNELSKGIVKTIEKTDYKRLLLDCPVGNSSVMYNVGVMGKFEVPDIRKRNDDALWLKMLKKEQYIWGMPEDDVLMKYRVRKDSLSRNKFKVVKYHWILYRDIEHLSVIQSIFHICWWGFIKIFHIK